MTLPSKESYAYRRAVDLPRELILSRAHPGTSDLREGVRRAIEEVGAEDLVVALVDSITLIAGEAAEDSGRDVEEYLQNVELQRTDRD